MSLPYSGPVLVCNPAEAALIHGLVDCEFPSPETRALRDKCRAVLNADPRWRKPLK